MNIEKIPSRIVPPPTYNITDLSDEEYKLIHWAVGRQSTSASEAEGFFPGVIESVFDALKMGQFS